jgi:hypothetical protein
VEKGSVPRSFGLHASDAEPPDGVRNALTLRFQDAIYVAEKAAYENSG